MEVRNTNEAATVASRPVMAASLASRILIRCSATPITMPISSTTSRRRPVASPISSAPAVFLIENVPLENLLSRGEPAEFAHNSAFGACGGGVIELIEPRPLARPGRGALLRSPAANPPHRLCRARGGGSDLRSSLDERGLPQYLSAQAGEVENTFHDASALLGHDLEIHRDCRQLRDVFGMVSGAAEGWDGSDPLRAVED